LADIAKRGKKEVALRWSRGKKKKIFSISVTMRGSLKYSVVGDGSGQISQVNPGGERGQLDSWDQEEKQGGKIPGTGRAGRAADRTSLRESAGELHPRKVSAPK